MKNKLTLSPNIKPRLKISLRTKLIVGASVLTILAGVIVFIIINTGVNKKSKANGPLSNNAFFDATNGSYIDFGRAQNLSCIDKLHDGSAFSMTITFWMKWVSKSASGVGGYANLISIVDSTGAANTNGTFWVQHNSSNTAIQFALNTSSIQTINSTTNPVEGTWYHVACVYDGHGSSKKMYLYINGALESSATQTGKIADFTTKSKLDMGRWCNLQENYRHFDGDLDEISIWNIALTPAQITSIMNKATDVTGTSYNASGLLGFWSFDNKTANDLTTCHQNGKVGSGVTLPVELVSFTGKKNNNEVDLKWITASELNNDYFTLERSKDGKAFSSIGTKKGAGNSNTPIEYTFVDTDPFKEINYYRLKQTDFNGTYKYSDIIAVNLALNDNDIGTMTAGPNPFNDNININYITEYAGSITVSLYDMQGKIVKQKQAVVDKGANTIYLNENQDLHSGMYLIGITQGDKKTPLIKLMKSN